MSLLMRASEIHGRPVVTLDTAEDVAEVKDVVFSHGEGALVGFTLNRRGFLGGPMAEGLAWGDVAALGPDAVMIPTREILAPRAETVEPEEGSQAPVLGNRVVSDAGRELGTVVDLILDVDDDADVVGYELAPVETAHGSRTRFIPLPDTFSVSGTALIVPAAAERFIRDDLAGFGGAVDDFRATLRGDR